MKEDEGWEAITQGRQLFQIFPPKGAINQGTTIQGNTVTVCVWSTLCSSPFPISPDPSNQSVAAVFCFSAFNNVWSNVGYVMLGFLFFLLVMRR